MKLTAKAVSKMLSRMINTSGIMMTRSVVNRGGVARLIDGDEKPEVLTATGPVPPTGQIQGVTAGQSTGLIETSTVDNSAASATRIWPDTGWLELKAASAL